MKDWILILSLTLSDGSQTWSIIGDFNTEADCEEVAATMVRPRESKMEFSWMCQPTKSIDLTLYDDARGYRRELLKRAGINGENNEL